MKLVSPDANNQVDPTIQRNILAHLNVPVTVCPISYQPNFIADVHTKISHGEKYCLIDFLEPNDRQIEYDKFWAWVKDNPPILHFKRELLAKDVTERLKPIEFPATRKPVKSHTREQYNARPFTVLFFWGYSHQSRPRLHGDIWRGMADDGISVLSHWDQIAGLNQIPADQRGPVWLSIYTPHWQRKTMDEIYPIIAQSKITVAMPGNDSKTFRHSECIDSLLATQITDRSWAYPWDNNNSIQLTPNDEFTSLLQGSKSEQLYDLYSECCDQMSNYFAPTYAKNYVQKTIEAVL